MISSVKMVTVICDVCCCCHIDPYTKSGFFLDNIKAIDSLKKSGWYYGNPDDYHVLNDEKGSDHIGKVYCNGCFYISESTATLIVKPKEVQK